jgi:hypothetical protein
MKKKVIVTQRNLKSGHLPQRGPDTKTNRPTDHWSQYNLNLFTVKHYLNSTTGNMKMWTSDAVNGRQPHSFRCPSIKTPFFLFSGM